MLTGQMSSQARQVVQDQITSLVTGESSRTIGFTESLVRANRGSAWTSRSSLKSWITFFGDRGLPV